MTSNIAVYSRLRIYSELKVGSISTNGRRGKDTCCN